MSATIDAGPVAGLLGSAPVLSADGRMFPVETIYAGRPDDRRGIPSAAARAAAALMSKYDGDALIFLPGASEIAAAAEAARQLMPDNIIICELYGSLGKKEQDEALSPAPDGRRKAVFSTNLAETSVTIEGVRIVSIPVLNGSPSSIRPPDSPRWKPRQFHYPPRNSPAAAPGGWPPESVCECGARPTNAGWRRSHARKFSTPNFPPPRSNSPPGEPQTLTGRTRRGPPQCPPPRSAVMLDARHRRPLTRTAAPPPHCRFIPDWQHAHPRRSRFSRKSRSCG